MAPDVKALRSEVASAQEVEALRSAVESAQEAVNTQVSTGPTVFSSFALAVLLSLLGSLPAGCLYLVPVSTRP